MRNWQKALKPLKLDAINTDDTDGESGDRKIKTYADTEKSRSGDCA
jgi:hypothetical protein